MGDEESGGPAIRRYFSFSWLFLLTCVSREINCDGILVGSVGGVSPTYRFCQYIPPAIRLVSKLDAFFINGVKFVWLNSFPNADIECDFL